MYGTLSKLILKEKTLTVVRLVPAVILTVMITSVSQSERNHIPEVFKVAIIKTGLDPAVLANHRPLSLFYSRNS